MNHLRIIFKSSLNIDLYRTFKWAVYTFWNNLEKLFNCSEEGFVLCMIYYIVIRIVSIKLISYPIRRSSRRQWTTGELLAHINDFIFICLHFQLVMGVKSEIQWEEEFPSKSKIDHLNYFVLFCYFQSKKKQVHTDYAADRLLSSTNDETSKE